MQEKKAVHEEQKKVATTEQMGVKELGGKRSIDLRNVTYVTGKWAWLFTCASYKNLLRIQYD